MCSRNMEGYRGINSISHAISGAFLAEIHYSSIAGLVDADARSSSKLRLRRCEAF